ncbi:hypothetical protein [Trebonia sp.]|uniref:hypothetical protein n=1 Tax=Trebonia sp. TaxID=2767075 RepID=UPI00260F26D9|nr:hypothetical protein [Trebonia sp.]
MNIKAIARAFRRRELVYVVILDYRDGLDVGVFTSLAVAEDQADLTPWEADESGILSAQGELWNAYICPARVERRIPREREYAIARAIPRQQAAHE